MRKRTEDTLSKIVETQAGLRDSIDVAKQLAAESERLIEKHRKTKSPQR